MSAPMEAYTEQKKEGGTNIMKKLFVLSPKRMALLTCVLAAALMFGAVNMPAVVASATQRQLPIYCVERDQKMISISFDAAWGDVILRQEI